ncbi:MAG: amidohydrolase [Lachnospiraceae bacterium]|nr:amidohydrolase [Lachnospiraceae bacterium]
MKRLLKNAMVVSTDDNGAFEVIKNGAVGINDDIIDYIGCEADESTYDEVRDMKGAILMPGLVNAHGHGPMTLLRGAGSGLALQDWLNKAIFPVEDKMKPEDIAAGEKWAVIEMLRSGTTLVSEMYDFPYASGGVLKAAGMKANICRVGLAFSDKAEIPPHRFDECVEFVNNWKDESGRVQAEFCLHSEYLTNEAFVRRIAEANSSLHKTVNIHVSETKKEHEECMERHGGLTPIQYLDKCGLLDEQVYAAHCVWVTDEDMEIMAAKKTTAVHNPASNCKLASGFARVPLMLSKGVNLAIGTDGVASNNNLNMFEELHMAAMISKPTVLDPTVTPAETILKMATVNGAKALGRKDTGELKVGKKADIIAVSMDAPHMYPAFDILNLLVYSAQGSDVIMTMVDGNILYDNGIYTTIDVEAAKKEFDAALARLY